MRDPRIERIRDALREFAYQPRQPVFSRYEAATADLAAIETLIAGVRSLLEVWDMSVDVLGPEWNGLAEKIESIRLAASAPAEPPERPETP